MIRVAINGFGRIGRAFVREAYSNPDIEIVAVNDLGSLENLAYLLKYDTVYKRAPFSVAARPSMDSAGSPQAGSGPSTMLIDGKEVRFCSEKDPAALPWRELEVDVVVESTGFFTEYEKARAHLAAGA